MRRRLAVPLLALALLGLPRPTAAHEAAETTASVVVRQGTVETWYNADVGRLLDALATEAQRPLLSDPTALRPESVHELTRALNGALDHTRLRIDGVEVAAAVVAPVRPDEVVAWLAELWQQRHPRATFQVRAELAGPGSASLRSVTLTSDPAFGPILASLSRPDSRMAAAGAPVTLRIEPPVAAAAPALTHAAPPRWLTLLPSLALAFGVWVGRRSMRVASTTDATENRQVHA